jgi:cytochrome P450
VRTVALDAETYSSDNDMSGERNGYQGAGATPRSPFQLIPSEVDPPLFYSYRKLLNPKFPPAAAGTCRPFVRQVTNAMIDGICQSGQCDLVKDLASPVPAMLAMRRLGLPFADWQEVSSPFHDIATEAAGSAGHQRAIEGMLRVMGRLTEELAKRRGDPQEDMLSYLAFAEMDDRPLSEQEIMKIGFVTPGWELKTSTSLLSHAFASLSDHPEAARRLLDDPELLRTATEEFLRWASPVPAMARTVTKETELGGQKLCPGDRLLISWLSANHDENVFDDPEDVRLGRRPNHHQAFGLGIHRCLGCGRDWRGDGARIGPRRRGCCSRRYRRSEGHWGR